MPDADPDPETGEILEGGRHIRPFAEWLIEQRRGGLAVELAEGLNELVDAVQMQGKGGKLTLTIKVEPGGKGQSNIVIVTDDVAVAAPKPARDSAVYFVDGNANLSRANPAQPALPLREVGAPSDDLREVAAP